MTTTRLQRRFGLPRALAREIVADGMQHALRHRWQPWAWLLAWLALPAAAVGAGWSLLAQWLGDEAMLVAAEDKAGRLGRRENPR